MSKRSNFTEFDKETRKYIKKRDKDKCVICGAKGGLQIMHIFLSRAKGMAEAMEVENGKLTDTYIKYLWVKNMNSSQNSKVYIPTEAGIPILEAK